jgi:ABC-type amino acid transport substrate-binding protein
MRSWLTVCAFAAVAVALSLASGAMSARFLHDHQGTHASRSPTRENPNLAPEPRKKVLRVSADPNNLPFTNDKLEGFEDKIAAILAEELGADVEYTWRAQRRGFFRAALKEGEAEVVLGVPVGFDMASTTAPYYRSSYVFVTRKDRGLAVKSFDEPSLKTLKVGVQMIGDDGTNTPPAHALPACAVYIVAGLALFAGLLRASERSVRTRELLEAQPT